MDHWSMCKLNSEIVPVVYFWVGRVFRSYWFSKQTCYDEAWALSLYMSQTLGSSHYSKLLCCNLFAQCNQTESWPGLKFAIEMFHLPFIVCNVWYTFCPGSTCHLLLLPVTHFTVLSAGFCDLISPVVFCALLQVHGLVDEVEYWSLRSKDDFNFDMENFYGIHFSVQTHQHRNTVIGSVAISCSVHTPRYSDKRFGFCQLLHRLLQLGICETRAICYKVDQRLHLALLQQPGCSYIHHAVTLPTHKADTEHAAVPCV